MIRTVTRACLYATLLALSSCGAASEDAGSTAAWHIFSADKAEFVANQCSRPSPGPISGTWSPTKVMISEFEGELISLLQQEIDSYSVSIDVEAADYALQYAGLVIEGEKIIYVNGFNLPSSNRDASKVISICDGGAITFGVEYVISEQRFRNFYFNGRI